MCINVSLHGAVQHPQFGPEALHSDNVMYIKIAFLGAGEVFKIRNLHVVRIKNTKSSN